MKYIMPVGILCGTLTLVPANAQETIGKATSARPQADSDGRQLSAGSDIRSQETVRTGEVGTADLQFHDESKLSIGSKSSVRLNKFVYDPNSSAARVAIQAARGSFRFATGSRGQATIKTPYGTLGIRG